MKKFIVAILIIAVLLAIFALPSCRPMITNDGEVSAAEVIEAINRALGVTAFCRGLYEMNAPQGSSRHLTPRLGVLVYQGNAEGVHELSILADFALFLSCDHSLYEVHAMRVYSIADREQIEKLLNRRLTLIRSREIYIFQPNAYETRIADAMVYSRGEWVFLLATGNNEKAIRAIRKVT
ncbi:MAG: hypothetical protein FWB93_06170 [Oscillospiraceae bacterium]|nr:hypothetical protein [Oscillospiraceae bacterium]